MYNCFLAGLRAARRHWPAALLLFVASALGAVGFSAATWSWLATALEKSKATRTLLADLDLNVFIDLLAHHADGLTMLGVVGATLLAVFGIVSVWVTAVVVLAVGEDLHLADAMPRGVRVYATFLWLAVITFLLEAAVGLGALLLGRTLGRWTAESPSEMTFYVVWAGTLGLAGVGLLFCAAVHDHARIHSAATGAGPVRAYTWALGFVARRERRALPLLAVLLGVGVVAWAVYQAVAMVIPTTSAAGVAGAIVWGECLMGARMFLRVWIFAAATELQSLEERAAP